MAFALALAVLKSRESKESKEGKEGNLLGYPCFFM